MSAAQPGTACDSASGVRGQWLLFRKAVGLEAGALLQDRGGCAAERRFQEWKGLSLGTSVPEEFRFERV